ncbi:hypothetical protein [Bradyrhizobium sp. BR13661]|uniref:hypothetical protein n=1 Tax=Bradyrhizobium sp. BR13661 TaxID=2940622 RepID=UPI0024745DE5|nr:hypothetical protein [Bradyrhizobium sp. BR13661]
MAVWGAIRLVLPSLDYYPPEGLAQSLQRSWFVVSGTHKAAQLVYALATLILMAVFFAMVQRRWPGRSGWNGLTFGVLLGLLWAFCFLNSATLFGTTAGEALLNGALDLAALALGGWLIGLALGRDHPEPARASRKPWLAILLIACGFASAYSIGALLLQGSLGQAAALFARPVTAPQYATLFMVGLWAGLMYVSLRPGLPFGPASAKAAFFAFGVFGHSWTLFKLYSVIEFSGVLLTVILIGLMGALGVFVGALAYEWATDARFLGRYSFE